MKMNEEVDAMRTLGLDPIEVLVVPRVLALILTLPLLGFFADMAGLLGGAADVVDARSASAPACSSPGCSRRRQLAASGSA